MLRRLATAAGLCCLAGLLGAGCAARSPSGAPLAGPVEAPLPLPGADRALPAEPTPPPHAEAPARDDRSLDEPIDLTHLDPPEARAETVQIVTEDLLTAVPDIAIPLNARVLGFVELFGGRLRTSLERGLSRGSQYLPMIRDVFREEGLPLDLAYIPLVESAFRTDAVSRASARGLWQFMRGTAVENGLRYDWYVDERSDPEKATRAAAQYLKALYARFENWHLALAAYNAGPARVQRALARSGHETFWDVAASSRHLPRETRDYVPLVLAAIVVARNPAHYGVELVPVDPPASEALALAHAVDLRRVAEWTETPVETIREMNPELRRWTTPLDTEGYLLRVPAGAAGPLRERLARLGPEDLLPTAEYVVTRGDTLIGVAQKLRVGRDDLAEANYLSREARLQIGQRLIVPRAPALAARDEDGPSPASARLASAAGGPTGHADAQVTHRVGRGDTLYSIARRYRTTVARLREWNRISGSLIRVGQLLSIGAPSALGAN